MLTKVECDDRFDMLTSKSSKFHFNDWLDRQNKLVRHMRYTIIIKDKKGLVELQRLNQSYFIKKNFRNW